MIKTIPFRSFISGEYKTVKRPVVLHSILPVGFFVMSPFVAKGYIIILTLGGTAILMAHADKFLPDEIARRSQQIFGTLLKISSVLAILWLFGHNPL